MNSTPSYTLTLEWNYRALLVMAKAAAPAPADTHRPVWLKSLDKTQELTDEILVEAIMNHLVSAAVSTSKMHFSGFGKLRAELRSITDIEFVMLTRRLGRVERDPFLQYCMANVPKHEPVLKITVHDQRGYPRCVELPNDLIPSGMRRFFTALS